MKKSITVLLFSLMVCALVLIFQNCSGGLLPLHDVVSLQSISDIDGSAIPRLLNSKDLAYRSTRGTVSVNKNPSLSESASAVIVFDRTMKGLIYRYYANEIVDEARISLDVDGMITIWHISNNANSTYTNVPLPEVSAGSQVTVAVTFGIGAEALVVLVNGVKQNLSLQKVGSPYDFSYVQKSTVLGGTGGNILEVVTFSSAISNLDLNVMSRYLANGQNIYNVAFDPSLINDTGLGGNGSTPDTPEFLAAKAIIDANCVTCHNGSNNGDFRNLTQAQFISKGLVVAKNPAASKIYYRLAGATSGPGPATMPQGGALSAADVAKIETWINSIQ